MWGDPNATSTIVIGEHQLPITKSLELALRQLRSKKAITLWIDAICINQSDIIERNSQVREMELIYEIAMKVNIWLGPETPHSVFGIEILSYLANAKNAAEKPPWEQLPPYLASAGLKDIMS